MNMHTISYNNLMSLIDQMRARKLPSDRYTYESIIVPKLEFINRQAIEMMDRLEDKQIKELVGALARMYTRMADHCERCAAELKKKLLMGLVFVVPTIVFVIYALIFQI